MIRKINRLNEEIARWAFEIIFKKNNQWIIAFTNPTAGPWKTIKSNSLDDGSYGEVYRFILEEDRPDIVMYNDSLKVVIVFEAKDSIGKLKEKEQSKKSALVVNKLANILSSKGTNPFWRGRENYKVITGLLWGNTDRLASEIEKEELFDTYYDLIKDCSKVHSSIIIGIETLYKNNELKCYAYTKTYDINDEELGDKIISTLLYKVVV